MQSVCLVNRYGASGSTWNSSSLVHSEDGVAKGGGMLRGYMYRTKHRNGICRITLFSNVSHCSSLLLALMLLLALLLLV